MFLLRSNETSLSAVIPLPFDWNILSQLARQIPVMQRLHFQLVALCDWEGMCCWDNVKRNIRRRAALQPSSVGTEQFNLLHSQLCRIQQQIRRQTGSSRLDRALFSITLALKRLEEDLESATVRQNHVRRNVCEVIMDHLRYTLAAGSAYTPCKQCNAHLISLYSLLSKSLCREWRPLLFRSLHLRSSTDLTLLRNLLHSRVSGWLSRHIIHIDISCELGSSLLASTVFFSGLPSLQTLRCTAPIAGKSPAPYHLFPITARLSMPTLRSLRTLSLHNYAFSSLITFLSCIDNLPSLEELLLAHIDWTWKPTDSDDLPCPTRGMALERLRHVQALHCPVAWQLAWVFACSSTGLYSTRWRRGRQDDGRCDVAEPVAMAHVVQCLLGESLRDLLEGQSMVGRPVHSAGEDESYFSRS